MEKKGFSFLNLLVFIFSIATFGLMTYGAFQPLIKGYDLNYLGYIKTFLDSFMDLVKSSDKDKLFPIIVMSLLIIVLALAILFSGIGALVILISGLVSLFGKRRIKTVWPLLAGSFHLAFISLLSSSYYYSEKVELGLGSILIIIGLCLSVLIHSLEEFFFGGNKTARHFIGSFVRTAISLSFIYMSIFYFQQLYLSGGVSVSQYVFSDAVYLSRIEEGLPKKLFAFGAIILFAIGAIVNIMVSLLPVICGSKSINESIRPTNHSTKYIVQIIILSLLLAGTFFGSIFITDNPKEYAMSQELKMMFIIFGAGLVLAIVAAIIDPKRKLLNTYEGSKPADLANTKTSDN